MTKRTLGDWQMLAERELRSSPEMLVWNTAEGIDVKPLYTESDVEGLDHLGSMPGGQ